MKVIAQLLLTFLLNASWQIALLVAFAALCDWLLRGLAARYRHALWVITMASCLFIPLLSCSPLAGRITSAKGRTTTVPAKPFVVSRIISPGVEESESSAPEIVPASPAKPEPPWPISLTSPIHVNRNIAVALAALYVLLLLWRVASLLRAWRRTRTIVKSAHEFAVFERVQTIIRECRTRTGATRARILCSTKVAVPITVGIVNPVVILPERLLDEVDDDLLIAAIGHELVHVVRRDYLANLIYEFIHMPLSFHPAAALVRRRIKQTRELCCDEAVAAKLLRPEVYARSLVRLIGSTPLPHLVADTTIGINQSDILEVRIMSLLKTSKLNSRGRTALLIAASFLLVTPCVTAAKLALSFDIDQQEPPVSSTTQQNQKRERQEAERAREELTRQARELKEQIKAAPDSQRAEIEARLREVQQNLKEPERAIAEFKKNAEEQDLRQLRQTLEEFKKSQPADQAKRKELEQQLAKAETKYPDDTLLQEAKEKLAAAEKSNQADRKVRVIYKTEPEYSEDARAKKIEGNVLLGFTVDHDGIPQNIQIKKSLYPSLDQAAIDAVRKWRFEPAMKGGQPVSMWLNVEVNFRLDYDRAAQEQNELAAVMTREGITVGTRRGESQGQEYGVLLSQEASRRAERDVENKQKAELASHARITMDQAIQIAVSQTPGKVLECSLIGEHWEAPGKLGKDSQVLYHVVILSGDETNPTTTHVLVNALDGTIYKTSKEERRIGYAESGNAESGNAEYSSKPPIRGGVLNGKASSLPNPEYPAIARRAGASGAVIVEIIIDEAGNVLSAHSVSGHPLLQAAAVSAARAAKFAPTRMNGEPVKVAGTLIYNFVAQ